MISEISFEKALPVLVALTACLVLAWLLFFFLSRAIRRWARHDDIENQPGVAERWATQFTAFLGRAISVAALLISTLILLYGLGIEGLPRLTWSNIVEWTNEYLVPIAFIVGSGYIVIRSLHLLIARLPSMTAPSSGSIAELTERRKRTETGGRLLQWAITAVVLAISALMVLRKVGVDITPFLTGSAIVGVAVGLGAQDLVKDVISGFFLILENQIRVGDVVEINGKGGLVESIRLRTIVLRGLDGTVHIIPNGIIREVSNRTKDFSYYVIDLGVAYKENVDDVIVILREVGEGLVRDPEYAPKILEGLEIMGVDDFADSAVVIKLRIRTVPLEQWIVGRELRRRIKNMFDERGIEIPYPHLSLYAGEATKPFPLTGVVPE